jgi:capsid protein
MQLFNLVGDYATGAKETTRSAPLMGGNVDLIDPYIGEKIRQQTKYLNVNGTDIPAMVAEATARTIGVTMTVQVESKDPVFNETAEQLIEEFIQIGVGELTGKHHFNSSARGISSFDLLDGGVMIRHHYLASWSIPYKYELVSVDMIDSSKNANVDQNGNRTVAGLVLNKWNQLTHLYIYSDERRVSSTLVSTKNITYYSEVWTSLAQQIAVSKLASILPTLDRLDQYTKAELQAAIDSAKAGAYLKSTLFAEIINIISDEMRMGITVEEKVAKASPYIKDLAQKSTLKGSGLTPIPAGDDVLFPNQKREGIYDTLTESSQHSMASSVGMSALGVYSRADKVNYSAMKYINETGQLNADIRFDNIANKILNEILTRLIRVGVQTKKIKVDPTVYWKNEKLFTKFRYLRQIKIDVEPAKTAQANKLNLELGLTNPKRIVEQAYGMKYEDFIDETIDAEIYAEKRREEKFKQAGLKTKSQERIEQKNKEDNERKRKESKQDSLFAEIRTKLGDI